MTDDERIERLNAVIHGTGATVNDAFGLWATHSELSDHHIAELAGWADLEFLIANSTKITDASIPSICTFRRLTDLSIGGNAITSKALITNHLPNQIEVLELCGILLTDEAVDAVSRCNQISDLCANDCELSRDAVASLAELPNLRVIEARDANATPEDSRNLSAKHPHDFFVLRDGLWHNGECRRKALSREME